MEPDGRSADYWECSDRFGTTRPIIYFMFRASCDSVS